MLVPLIIASIIPIIVYVRSKQTKATVTHTEFRFSKDLVDADWPDFGASGVFDPADDIESHHIRR